MAVPAEVRLADAAGRPAAGHPLHLPEASWGRAPVPVMGPEAARAPVPVPVPCLGLVLVLGLGPVLGLVPVLGLGRGLVLEDAGAAAPSRAVRS